MFRVEKRVERKSDKLYVKWKSYNNSFNSWIDKKKQLYKMSYFPELYTHCKNKKKIELDLSNYIKKSDLTTQQVLIHQILPKSLIQLA